MNIIHRSCIHKVARNKVYPSTFLTHEDLSSMNSYILGIDISKNSFDVALLIEDKVFCKKLNNNQSGFDALEKWLNNRRCDKLHAA